MTKFAFEYHFISRVEIEASTAKQAQQQAETHAAAMVHQCNMCALAFDESIKLVGVSHTGGSSQTSPL